jgi:hypothetical protein
MNNKLTCIAISRLRPVLEDLSFHLHLYLKRSSINSCAHPNLYLSSHYLAARIGYLVPLVT